jgi:predicted neutral ceramidase superfamily lipid hydrolase
VVEIVTVGPAIENVSESVEEGFSTETAVMVTQLEQPALGAVYVTELDDPLFTVFDRVPSPVDGVSVQVTPCGLWWLWKVWALKTN